jgi:hypothetical protein
VQAYREPETDLASLNAADDAIAEWRMLARNVIDGHLNGEPIRESVQLLEASGIEESPVSGDWLAYLRTVRGIPYPQPRPMRMIVLHLVSSADSEIDVTDDTLDELVEALGACDGLIWECIASAVAHSGHLVEARGVQLLHTTTTVVS